MPWVPNALSWEKPGLEAPLLKPPELALAEFANPLVTEPEFPMPNPPPGRKFPVLKLPIPNWLLPVRPIPKSLLPVLPKPTFWLPVFPRPTFEVLSPDAELELPLPTLVLLPGVLIVRWPLLSTLTPRSCRIACQGDNCETASDAP